MMMSLQFLLFVLARPKNFFVIVLLCPLKFFRRASHAGISMGRSSTVLNALPWLETSKSMPSTRTRFHQDAKWRRMKTNYPKQSYMVILSTTYNQEALETLSQSSCFVFPPNFPDFPFHQPDVKLTQFMTDVTQFSGTALRSQNFKVGCLRSKLIIISQKTKPEPDLLFMPIFGFLRNQYHYYAIEKIYI